MKEKRYIVAITEGSIYRAHHFNNREHAEAKYKYFCTFHTGRASFFDLETREYISQNNLFKESESE